MVCSRRCPNGGLNLDFGTVTVIPTPHSRRAMTWTRPLFETACKAFVQHRHDWAWVEHPVLPGLGYMYRTTPLQRRSVDGDPSEPADDPAAAMPGPDHITCHQSVVFSATFQVPTFYFSVYDSSACDFRSSPRRYISFSAGSPIGLSEIIHTSLLRKHAFDGMDATAFSIGDLASNFPLLSFGDHPCLGLQCWYLHPCETGPAVEEVLAARLETHPRDSAEPIQWLEAWFLVLGCVVELGERSTS